MLEGGNMKKPMKYGAALGTAVALSVAAFTVPAFAVDSAATAAGLVEGSEPDGDAQYPGKEFVIDHYEYWDQIAEDYAPVIKMLPNGKLVQPTPTEYKMPHWQWQSWTESYNTYWIDADSRGCNSCHTDLNDTVMGMHYMHAVLPSPALETYSDVTQCISCHRDNGDDFGNLMHGMHYNARTQDKFEDNFNGSCMSCHTATGDGEGFKLYEEEKYHLLKDSIDHVKADEINGKFSYTQDKVQSMDELYSYDFVHGYYDHMRYACSDLKLDLEMPQSMMDEWTITIDGNVNEPYTAKLVDLIAEAEAEGVVVTKPSKMVCDLNPIGGAGIGQTEITGIPVSWLFEKAGGFKDDTQTIRCIRADGSSKNGVDLDMLDKEYLVYKMGGEYLDARRGYPCTNWVETLDAQVFSKQCNGYSADAKALKPRVCGQVNQEGLLVNRPNATICGTPEGLIVETGKPYTFQGYVDAYDLHVTQIEFSMDGGETWDSYELNDTDTAKWIWWEYEFTPATHGAYVLTVRATDESGNVSYKNHEVMINAKDELPASDKILKPGAYDDPTVIAFSDGKNN